MSERKVINKYYSPDYDEASLKKSSKKQKLSTRIESRIMLPMSLQCLACGEFIYKGKKFNAKKELVKGETYLNLRLFRFIFRCSFCLAHITFKTDPKNADYVVESGATRNFEPWKAKALTEKEIREEREKEDQDVLKKLENKSKDSRREMELNEAIEEMKEKSDRDESLLRLKGVAFLPSAHREREKREAELEEQDREEARIAFEKRRLQRASVPLFSSSSSLSSPSSSSSSSSSSLFPSSTKPSLSASSDELDGDDSASLDFELSDEENDEVDNESHVKSRSLTDKLDADAEANLSHIKQKPSLSGFSFSKKVQEIKSSQSQSFSSSSSLPPLAPSFVSIVKRKNEPLVSIAAPVSASHALNVTYASQQSVTASNPSVPSIVLTQSEPNGLQSLLSAYGSDSDED